MSPELIVVNGKLITMDERPTRADAVAISGGKIAALGKSADIKRLKGRKTRVIDAGGNTVMPGLIEGHMHVFAGGAAASCLDLYGTANFEHLAQRLSDYAQNHAELAILVGFQLNYGVMGEGKRLTRHDLDRIVSDRPVLLYAPDNHTAWANSKALERAGILHGRKLTPGHEIVMGSDGLAEGELREAEAVEPVAAIATELTRARLALITGGEPDPYPGPNVFARDMDAVLTGLKLCAGFGITSFHNMDGNLYLLEVLSALDREGQLLARARVPFHFKPFMPLAALERASTMAKCYQGDMVRAGFVKMFMDGVLDSGTAVMLDDYGDQPGWRGDPLFSQAQFNDVCVEADRRGLQIAVHAIGDGAVNMVINGYEKAASVNRRKDSRHRVEHIEVVYPPDIKRFKKLGVIASMQPPHPPGQHGLPLEPTLSKIGRHRWKNAYAWNDFRKAGVPLEFATDWPVSDLNPWRSMGAAMTRKAWAEDVDPHRQTLMEAVHGYTAAGAFAEFAEGKKGILRKGALGDVVVLDRDIESEDPERLQEVKVRATVLGGRVVFDG